MKKILSFLTLATLIFFVFLTSCEKDTKEETGNISGIVNHSITNEPLEGVNITLSPNVSSSFTTGADGKYTFNDLPLGSYQVQAIKDGYETNSKSVTVTANKTSQADIALRSIGPEISISTESLDFGADLTSLPVTITNSGQGILDWSISEDVSWLSVNPLSGSITSQTANIILSVNRSGMGTGSYHQSISIVSNGGSATINITMVVDGGPLEVFPNDIAFSANETDNTIQITNSSMGEISYNISSNNSWISFDQNSGVVENEIDLITVSVDRTGLEYGIHQGTIIINSSENSLIVNVVLTISDPNSPLLSLSSYNLNFGSSETEKSLTISNAGGADLSWSVSNSIQWLDLSLNSGTINPNSSEGVILNVNRSVMTPGHYQGQLQFTSNGGNLFMEVEMDVDATPILSYNPHELFFEISNQSQNLEISNLGNGLMNWELNANKPWISLSMNSGTNQETINVTIDFSQLSYGQYSGQIDVNTGNAGGGNVLVYVDNSQPAPPTVTTEDATNITVNAADISGRIDELGTGSVVQHGHCWSTSPNPTTSNSITALGVANETTNFLSLLTGLTANTTYYARSYATNNEGTAYSQQISFVTIQQEILITSPNNSTQWTAGNNETILWEDNISGYVLIELYKSNVYQQTIASSVTSNGSFIWNIPNVLEDGSDYKIKIASISNPSVNDYSDNFIIDPMDEYGNGEDGIFTGGEIDRSRNYYFSEINMQSGSVMTFANEGNGGIYVQGNFTLASGAQISLRQGENLNAGVFNFQGHSRNLSETVQSPGGAGNGGNGTSSSGYVGGAGGNGGSNNNSGEAGGQGGTSSQCWAYGGDGGDFPSGDGQNGSQCTYGSYTWGGGGGGGASGTNGLSAEKVAFVVGGNVSLLGTISGVGTDGSNGGNGGDGAYSKQRGSGGGGGGGGGAGGHGGIVYIFSRGGYNNNSNENLYGGSGGSGGFGGSKGGVGYSYPEGSDGDNGSSGSSGENGFVEYIQTYK